MIPMNVTVELGHVWATCGGLSLDLVFTDLNYNNITLKRYKANNFTPSLIKQDCFRSGELLSEISGSRT